MATVMSRPVIADRNDIHKSCKTLEVVVNVLNDYCEAANAIVSLQKKLAKALKEGASVKCVSEIAANALNTSATIFETLSEVDTKFVKLADKECDAISTEVKKWFKKLAKAERAHDDRIADANAKIKQAGQSYEKKSKKHPQDAAEEHTRYINILSTLGPEVNQEKHNHALFVTQRHSATIYSVAACLSRVADSEWLRSCEGVRRFSPTVGQLGEWRAFCEGAWSGAVPTDLADVDAEMAQSDSYTLPDSAQEDHKANTTGPERNSRELMIPRTASPAPGSSRHSSEQERAPSFTSRAMTPSGQSPASSQYLPVEQFTESRSQVARQGDSQDRAHSNASLASLASFPSPPTHFPLPPVARHQGGATLTAAVRDSATTTQPVSTSSSDLVSPRVTEFPRSESPMDTPPLTERSLSPTTPRHLPLTPIISPLSNTPDKKISPDEVLTVLKEKSEMATELSAPGRPAITQRSPSSSSGVPPGVGSSVSGSSTREEYNDVGEFGERKENRQDLTSRSPDVSPSKDIVRSDTTKSTGSMVAALRDRYSRTAGSSSPHRKEPPRLPTHVPSLANRYDSSGIMASAQSGTMSLTDERRHTSLELSGKTPQRTPMDLASGASTKYLATGSMPEPATDVIILRRQRIEELEDLEIREQEYELRMKEREIEQKAKDLERERVRLLNARKTDGYTSDGSRGTVNRVSQRLPVESPSPSPTMQQARYPLYSYSTANLAPSPASSRQLSSQPSSPTFPPSDHASYCGCDACSASKYRVRDTAPAPRDLRPPEPPLTLRPEKPKGWIRRLSMPVVGNAFSSDSKKNLGVAGIARGTGYRSSLTLPDEDGMLRKDVTGGIRNRSTTNLVRR
ncbi:hypothetical protein AcW1_008612 [Taiwanofungus camphoratus]|nr:hypothetical protein AcW1_008612 [Antrodia cinnamomea]KAI0956498.1 hypothetical protein AcV7_006885 [Antrodia cinnamomea]